MSQESSHQHQIWGNLSHEPSSSPKKKMRSSAWEPTVLPSKGRWPCLEPSFFFLLLITPCPTLLPIKTFHFIWLLRASLYLRDGMLSYSWIVWLSQLDFQIYLVEFCFLTLPNPLPHSQCHYSVLIFYSVDHLLRGYIMYLCLMSVSPASSMRSGLFYLFYLPIHFLYLRQC